MMRREYLMGKNRVNRTVLKIIVACEIIILTILFPGYCKRPVYAEEYMTARSGGVILKASRIVWKYKVENGILWKRKYNVDMERWIGDWIRA